jgi:circadian clock protein KaiC
MYVLKSRGMSHSNQIREFLLTDHGIELSDVYLGALMREQEIDAKQRELDRKREALEARITALRKEFEAEEEQTRRAIDQDRAREEVRRLARERMGDSRQTDNGSAAAGTPRRPRTTQRSRK